MAVMDIQRRDDLAFPQSLPEFQRLFPINSAGVMRSRESIDPGDIPGLNQAFINSAPKSAPVTQWRRNPLKGLKTESQMAGRVTLRQSGLPSPRIEASIPSTAALAVATAAASLPRTTI
jgi:hypothetical protein